VAAAGSFAERVQAYMRKAIREAKTHTSWLNQNSPYEDAVARFVASTLTDAGGRAFVQACLPFIRRVAALGMLNSLAQLVLKIGAPGVPDFYQGTERWQLELADPDNRQPVDFAERRRLLEQVMPCIQIAEARRAAGGGDARSPLEDRVADFVRHWTDGRIKTYITACALRLRRAERDLLSCGEYVPLAPTGPRASHLVAFARTSKRKTLVVVVPRLVGGLTPAPEDGVCRPDIWHDTHVPLPPPLDQQRFVHVFTGGFTEPGREDQMLSMADVCRACPVAMLISRG
jgi:(1->4)-alpha-D-glucan 1-alpha-D-glucosylmutase